MNPTTQRREVFANTGALAGLSLSMLMSSLGTSIANVALPTLATVFGVTFREVQWIILAYLLAITVTVVGAGRLGDLAGRRRTLTAGMAVFTLASVLCAFAPSLGLLLAARAIAGLGAAVMLALTMAFIGQTVPKEKAGAAMGLLGSMSAVGVALGPSLGGFLIATFGWPAIFLVNLPLGMAGLALVYRFLPADQRALTANPGLDLAGTLALAMTLAAYALAMTLGGGSVGLLNMALLALAAAGAALFIRIERRARAPLVPLAMFREPALGAGFAMNILVTTVVMATLVVGPFHLSGALGLELPAVGLAMSCGPAAAACMGWHGGRLVDRFGAQGTIIAGLCAMSAGCALMALAPAGFGVAGYLAALVIITTGYALHQAANNTAIMAACRPDRKGLTSGLLALSRNLGLLTGASLMGTVFAVAGMPATFGVAGMLVLAALGIAVLRPIASCTLDLFAANKETE